MRVGEGEGGSGIEGSSRQPRVTPPDITGVYPIIVSTDNIRDAAYFVHV